MNNNFLNDLSDGVASFDSVSNQLCHLRDNLNSMTSLELFMTIENIISLNRNTKVHFEGILDKITQFKKNGFN